MNKYHKATITLNIPIVQKEKKQVDKTNENNLKIVSTIPMTYDVKGMIRIIEAQLSTFISTDKKISKPQKGTRYEEALFMLRELKKFYLLDEANIKIFPIVK